jgi:serine/threonine-protein kinase RsbW
MDMSPAILTTITLPGTRSDLPKVACFVEDACRAVGVPESVCFDVQLAVEEACANVIEHAYRGQGGQFSVIFECTGRDLHITVQDAGESFDPATIAKPDFSVPLEERPLGGLGLYLMRQLMDEVRFQFSQPTGNRLEMVKRNVAACDTGVTP